MTRIALALVLVGFPALAWAGEYDIAAFPGEPPPPSVSSHSSLDMPIQKLAADPGAAAVIDRNIPGLLNNSHYPVIKTMSLRTVAKMSSGRITKATLIEVSDELTALNKK